MTPTQTKVLAFIRKFQHEEKCSPTGLEIAFNFKWSKANAYKHIDNLVRLGYLEKTPIGTLRMWRPLTLPVYSTPL